MKAPPSVTNLMSTEPFYVTDVGAAYQGNSQELLTELPDACIDLVVTSPPFALLNEKEYGNEQANEYVDWFEPFAEEVYRVLTEDGSFVIDMSGAWQANRPVRSQYQFQLVNRLAGPDGRFELAQELFWYNPAKLPTPAQYVTIERVRLKDAVDYVWWFSKSEDPEADNRRVLSGFSESQKQLMEHGYRDKKRPSGHDISDKFDKVTEVGAIRPNLFDISSDFPITPDGDKKLAPLQDSALAELLRRMDVNEALVQSAFEDGLVEELAESILGSRMPTNVIEIGNTDSQSRYLKRCAMEDVDPHPARFPDGLPEFIIRFLTDPKDDDIVLDIFGGSNVTGRLAEELDRRWITFELEESYLETSRYRFPSIDDVDLEDEPKPSQAASQSSLQDW